MSIRPVPCIADWEESKVKERVNRLMAEGILEDKNVILRRKLFSFSHDDKFSYLSIC